MARTIFASSIPTRPQIDIIKSLQKFPQRYATQKGFFVSRASDRGGKKVRPACGAGKYWRRLRLVPRFGEAAARPSSTTRQRAYQCAFHYAIREERHDDSQSHCKRSRPGQRLAGPENRRLQRHSKSVGLQSDAGGNDAIQKMNGMAVINPEATYVGFVAGPWLVAGRCFAAVVGRAKPSIPPG
jgi:hypothetical protein